MRHRFQERYGFVFRVDRFTSFRVFGTVPEVFCDPFVACVFLDSRGLSDFSLYPSIEIRRLRNRLISTRREERRHIFIGIFGIYLAGDNYASLGLKFQQTVHLEFCVDCNV